MTTTKVSADQIIRKCDKIFRSEERTNAEWIWTLISEFIMPNQHGLFAGQDSRGAKKTRRLYDSTAIQANHDLASSMHSTLTNPATKWARFRFSNQELNDDPESVAWLEQANDTFHEAFSASNFNNEVAKQYKSLSSLGSSILMQEELDMDDDGGFAGFNFKAWHLSEVAWSENMKGSVDVVYRKFKLTARQAAERWDKKLPDVILKSLEEDPEKEFSFVHCIAPRDKKLVKVDPQTGTATAKNRPFASIYVSRMEPMILEEGGYYELPVHAVRWETMPGEVYGRGPGHIALPDVRTLNRAKELGLHAINKSINPPVIAEQRSVLSALDLRPGQVSVVKDINGIREMVTQARFDVTQFAVEDLRTSIKAIFFLDKLFLPDRRETGEMTAFEIATRTQQLQQVIGPTLGRLNTELLDPVVKRGFSMMLRGGAFGQLPTILQETGGAIEVEYVNSLSRSQKIEDVTAISQWLQELGLIAQIKPEVVDNINADEIARLVARRRGVPEAAVQDKATVDQQRQQRQQQMEQQQALEAGVQMADMAAKASQAGGGSDNGSE
jgi:hypothetical protein